MAVNRQPPPAVDPATVSSEPSALVQQQQPTQAAPVDGQQGQTYVSTPPPAPRPEAYPTQTSPDWVWAPGYWYWYGGQYVWIAGQWIPARRGHVYVSARWMHTGRGWLFAPGGWAVGPYDSIVYPVYPYDPFYYGYGYGPGWRHPYYYYGRGYYHHHGRDRLQVRPDRFDTGRRPVRAPPAQRLRVRGR